MLASPGARADRSLSTAPAQTAGWIDRHLGALARTRVLEGLSGWREGRLTVTMPDGASVVLVARLSALHVGEFTLIVTYLNLLLALICFAVFGGYGLRGSDTQREGNPP